MQFTLKKPQSPTDRVLGWWYRIAAPPDVPEDAPLRDREIVRVGKLNSAALLIMFIYITIVVGVGLTSNPKLLPILIGNYIAIFVAILLNRWRKATLAAWITFLTLEFGMILNIMNLSSTGGLSSFNLSLFDILVQPELIAVSLFAAWIVLPVAAINCVLIWAFITFLPRTPEFAHSFAAAPYNAYERPIAIQIIAALVSYLWASSAIQEMKRANRAEEVNKLSQALAEQQRAALEEKQQLEESIQQIVDVHTQIANGNFNARVPLTQKNILWSIGGSLNNLLARLQRWRQDAVQLQRTHQAIEQVLADIHTAESRGGVPQLRRTGTAIDPLLAEFAAWNIRSSVSNTRLPASDWSVEREQTWHGEPMEKPGLENR